MSTEQQQTNTRRQNSFFVELVSNASADIYPENTLSSFGNFFSNQISLDGDWEVGLFEISFSAHFNNVIQSMFVIKRTLMERIVWVMALPEGLYTSYQSIIDEMNKQCKKAAIWIQKKDFGLGRKKRVREEDKECYREGATEEQKRRRLHSYDGAIDLPENMISAELNEKTGKLTLKSQSYYIVTIRVGDLQQILGLEEVDTPSKIYGDTAKECKYMLDLGRYHSVYVYLDIIENTLVGDAHVPLLRASPFPHNVEEGFSLRKPTDFQEWKQFQKIQYKPLRTNDFHSVKVKLCTETGQLFPFQGLGVTRLTLRFRQRN